MDGKRVPKRIPEIKPAGVIVRRSTEVLATHDEDLVRAVRYIREHACRPISPDDVVQHVNISRSSLESRCRNVLGRSLHQEIRKVQIDTARALLADTELPIKQVALRAGFKNVQYLTRVFGSIVGQPPAVYRRGIVR
jgi:LacI family transcriptional regulator